MGRRRKRDRIHPGSRYLTLTPPQSLQRVGSQEGCTLTLTLPSCPSGHTDGVTRQRLPLSFIICLRMWQWPLLLLFAKAWLVPGGLAGTFEGCSEHTTGLVFSVLALAHPTQPARV